MSGLVDLELLISSIWWGGTSKSSYKWFLFHCSTESPKSSVKYNVFRMPMVSVFIISSKTSIQLLKVQKKHYKFLKLTTVVVLYVFTKQCTFDKFIFLIKLILGVPQDLLQNNTFIIEIFFYTDWNPTLDLPLHLLHSYSLLVTFNLLHCSGKDQRMLWFPNPSTKTLIS